MCSLRWAVPAILALASIFSRHRLYGEAEVKCCCNTATVAANAVRIGLWEAERVAGKTELIFPTGSRPVEIDTTVAQAQTSVSLLMYTDDT